MVSKARVFSAMVKHCYDFKVVAKNFADMVRPKGTGILADAFATWKKNLFIARKEDMASLFMDKRAS